jgi:hypothetical protein
VHRPILHVERQSIGPWDEAGLLSETMSSRGDTPKIIIIAVSTAGALLLVINITLITCYLIRRRKKKCMEEGKDRMSPGWRNKNPARLGVLFRSASVRFSLRVLCADFPPGRLETLEATRWEKAEGGYGEIDFLPTSFAGIDF